MYREHKKRVYVVDLAAAINKFTKRTCYPELPTIDVDVAMDLLMDCFQAENVPAAIDARVLEMTEKDWLIEDPAWVDQEEEVEIRKYLYHALQEFAWSMYKQLETAGFFYHPDAKYSYRKVINDHTIALTRIP